MKKSIEKKRTITGKPTKAVGTSNTEITQSENVSSFPIVAIGASAGGLEAFEKFFKYMPADCGMAFVLIQHLDPTHKSILTELVKRATPMKVSEVTDGMRVEPNCAYVIPPNRDMAILHGSLQLIEPMTSLQDVDGMSMGSDSRCHSPVVITSNAPGL